MAPRVKFFKAKSDIRHIFESEISKKSKVKLENLHIPMMNFSRELLYIPKILEFSSIL